MPNINIFDQTLKIITRDSAELLLHLAFPNIPVQLIGSLENVELALPTQRVDFVHQVVYQEQNYLLHVEFQLEHEADFPRRLCGYYGALTAQFKQPVLTLALYLRPRTAPVPHEYTISLGEQVVNRFSYPVLKLWDYVDDIRNGRYRELAPLLLTLVNEPSVEVLQTERTLILSEPDDQKRATLMALAVAIAARYFDKTFLWRFFREELAQMKQATFIEEWIEEGIEEGLQRGLQKGIQEGKQQGLQEGVQAQRETILQILEFRFHPSPAQVKELAQKLAEVDDLSMLKTLAGHALRDFSVDDFRAKLSQILLHPITVTAQTSASSVEPSGSLSASN